MLHPGRNQLGAFGPRAYTGLGPWGLFLVNLLAMFALAPRLSGWLGEFWSQAAMLPIWVAFYALIHLFRFRREARHDRR